MCFCVPVCLFYVLHARPQFRANLHEIWCVACLYPTDGHGGGLASAARALGSSELAGGRRNGLSAVRA